MPTCNWSRLFALFSVTFLPALGTAQQLADAETVVTRGTATIRFEDIDARVSKVPEQQRAGFMNDPERIEKLLQGLLLNRQMAEQARALGLEQDPIVAAEIRLAAEEVLSRHRFEVFKATLAYPDFEPLAKERYLTAPEQYQTPESVTVRHLLVERQHHGDEAANKLAESLREKYLESPGDFEAFVVAHSEEGGVDKHRGLLSDLVRQQTDGDFERMAFELKQPGEISPVTPSRFGYHIIQLISRKDSEKLPYEKVRDAILATLREEFIKRATTDYLETLRAEPMVAQPERVQSLRTRYLPDGQGAAVIATTVKTAAASVAGGKPAD